MEGGEGSSNGRLRRSQKPKRQLQKRASRGITFERSVENLSRAGRETLALMNRTRQILLNSIPHNLCAVFDNSCLHYRWIRSGWLVEERQKLAGRLYRYYYDPMGQMYRFRHEVETIYRTIDENNRVVIILDD
ncbi:unnamed protein product [Arabis nemorensis]|uniref:MBD domain-containing protein n=1 Tax=Arabis nemorensis TaxID=586526 RepID=A0A565B6N3_9BRAS|nr:unnamed protein product [Arabis nemorensis]